jgi:hypothetical protein
MQGEDKSPPRDRHAYLEEQIEKQKRGEPIDVDWVRAELGRVQEEAQRRITSSQRNLRWLVVGMGVLFCVLWVGGRVLENKDPKLLVPIVLIVSLAAWAVYRQRRKR